MKLIALPAFTDNHIRMLRDDRCAIDEDSADAAPVMGAPTAQQLTLGGILVTRRRGDRIGGLDGLRLLRGPAQSGP
jgi:hydroxyacylglutathione hydrolase